MEQRVSRWEEQRMDNVVEGKQRVVHFDQLHNPLLWSDFSQNLETNRQSRVRGWMMKCIMIDSFHITKQSMNSIIMPYTLEKPDVTL